MNILRKLSCIAQIGKIYFKPSQIKVTVTTKRSWPIWSI